LDQWGAAGCRKTKLELAVIMGEGKACAVRVTVRGMKARHVGMVRAVAVKKRVGESEQEGQCGKGEGVGSK